MQESLSYLGCSRSLLLVGPFSRVSRDLAASLLGGSDPAATLDTAVVANYFLDWFWGVQGNLVMYLFITQKKKENAVAENLVLSCHLRCS